MREKTKAYLTYLISLIESNVLNIREKAIWGSMDIYFYTIDLYVPHGNGCMHIIGIHESELNNKFFTIFNQKFNRCKENFTTFVPLKPFKFEIVVNFIVFHNGNIASDINVLTSLFENTRIDSSIFDLNFVDRDSESENETVINTSQIFKSENCVICLSTKPNILFCNCGHLCLCVECNGVKNLKKCPVCKTENMILRIIE